MNKAEIRSALSDSEECVANDKGLNPDKRCDAHVYVISAPQQSIRGSGLEMLALHIWSLVKKVIIRIELCSSVVNVMVLTRNTLGKSCGGRSDVTLSSAAESLGFRSLGIPLCPVSSCDLCFNRSKSILQVTCDWKWLAWQDISTRWPLWENVPDHWLRDGHYEWSKIKDRAVGYAIPHICEKLVGSIIKS